MMNRTKIDWADMSWNPVTGCLHDCPYCYARRIAERFGQTANADGGSHGVDQSRVKSYYEAAHHTGPYPYGFDPTIYYDRLSDPAKAKKPQTIFTCSMADLFGEWVPVEWIQAVFEACEKAPQHRYLFLTKNPGRYDELIDTGILPERDNMWYGTTCTDMSMPLHWNLNAHTFMSCEPMLAPWPAAGRRSNQANMLPEWVILGAETGNRKGKVTPERHWVENAVAQCRANGQAVFMKESLRSLMGEDFVQEYPWGGGF